MDFIKLTDGDGEPVILPIERIVTIEMTPPGSRERESGVMTMIRIDSHSPNGNILVRVVESVEEIAKTLDGNRAGSKVLRR